MDLGRRLNSGLRHKEEGSHEDTLRSRLTPCQGESSGETKPLETLISDFQPAELSGPIMEKDFQDIQQLDPEDNDHQLSGGEGPGTCGQNPRRENPFWKGPSSPRPLRQRLCSSFRLSLLALGFNVLLLVAVCVIGSQSTQLQMELRTLEEAFSNFSSSTLMEIRALDSHGGRANDKLTSLGAKLEKKQQDLQADHATLHLHLKHFPVDLRTLTCQMVFLQSNGTECCPINWMEHEGSCYWFSRAGMTWPEAHKYCQLENAHLVVINSWEEQKFIAQHTGPFHTWIGLTDSEGSWKWVDGTEYRYSYKNWALSQREKWWGREVGGSEDCVEVLSSGYWNDNFCQQVNRWVCEMRRNITG
ncbi:PREDICTED: asialoglycoprotein receptor 2 isoform X3 [Chinchilla lanigera]|uniref:asialoglycoprotein receptor 2 isoform X3 n=1 Tax=Chinchilla lanigera TaxID=34839 RepID=UPI000698864C|nr:PREDICTED: asialoglycoprotein receptor 2 isoform X3 [Chinchilla lanigera]